MQQLLFSIRNRLHRYERYQFSRCLGAVLTEDCQRQVILHFLCLLGLKMNLQSAAKLAKAQCCVSKSDFPCSPLPVPQGSLINGLGKHCCFSPVQRFKQLLIFSQELSELVHPPSAASCRDGGFSLGATQFWGVLFSIAGTQLACFQARNVRSSYYFLKLKYQILQNLFPFKYESILQMFPMSLQISLSSSC